MLTVLLWVDGDGGSEAVSPELRRWAPAARFASGTALAPGTAAVELDPVVRDAEAPLGRDPPAEGAGVRLGGRALHVRDPAATQAREVMVLGHVAVEASVRSGQLLHQAFGHEQPQVAIDRAEAHPRESATHHLVDPLRGRMRLGGAHHVEHHAARPG